MSVKLLETRVYEGKNITAVSDGTRGSCCGCVLRRVLHLERTTCADSSFNRFPCLAIERGESVIWMHEDDALKARLRNKI